MTRNEDLLSSHADDEIQRLNTGDVTKERTIVWAKKGCALLSIHIYKSA